MSIDQLVLAVNSLRNQNEGSKALVERIINDEKLLKKVASTLQVQNHSIIKEYLGTSQFIESLN